jgi:hypothetical protein
MDRNELKAAVAELAELHEEMREIETMLREAHPGSMARLAEIRREIPSLQSTIKDNIRGWGPGNHEFSGGHFIRVNNAPIKATVDVDGLLERAEERGEVQDLLDAEVLTYKVNVHQIERLPDAQMKVVYKGYIEETEGTASVSLPSQLK